MFRLAFENKQNCISPQIVRNAYLFKTPVQETTAGVIKMGLPPHHYSDLLIPELSLAQLRELSADGVLACCIPVSTPTAASPSSDLSILYLRQSHECDTWLATSTPDDKPGFMKAYLPEPALEGTPLREFLHLHSPLFVRLIRGLFPAGLEQGV